MSRVVLGIDTATEAIAVALATWPDDDGPMTVVAEHDERVPRASLSRLLPTVARLLGEEGLTPAALDLVVAGRGPGSYTGVRIGLAAAKGLAQGLRVPIMGVGTLDAVAWTVARVRSGLLGVVGDAMRQEVYPGLFELQDGRARRLGPDEVADPLDVARRWSEEVQGPLLLAGDGLAKHGQLFTAELGERADVVAEEAWFPTGRGVLGAAHGLDPMTAVDPGAVLPVYTRLSDAEHHEPGRATDVPPSGVAGPDGGPR